MRRAQAHAMVAFAVLVASGIPLVAAHPSIATHQDVESNNTCGTANVSQSSYSSSHMGSVSSSDASDFFKLSVGAANLMINVELVSFHGPNNYNLYLWPPSCGSFVAFSANPGTSTEEINYVSTTSGDYRIEIRWFSGSGDYDLYASSASQFTTCSATGDVVVSTPTDISCVLTTPVCGATPCTITYSAHIEGTGVVAASYRNAKCSAVGGACTGSSTELDFGTGLSGTCRSRVSSLTSIEKSAAVDVTLTCSAWI